MAYPAYLRDKARTLRTEKKLSLDEIAARLALGKTTVWYWIQDLPDPAIKHRDSLGRRRGREAGARANRARAKARRDEAYKRGRDEFALLDSLPGFRDFVCMYIGEGYKRNRNRVSLGNSDPRVIWLADHWIRRFSKNRVTYRFQHHADQDPEYLRRFWAYGLNVDIDLVRFQRKSNSGKLAGRTWRSKHGVLTVCANDTLLRARLQAWMDRVEEEWVDSIYRRGVAKPGNAPALGAGDPRFKSGHPD